jgi:hypothetical protein
MEISGIGSLTRSIVLVVIGFFEEGVMLLAWLEASGLEGSCFCWSVPIKLLFVFSIMF